MPKNNVWYVGSRWIQSYGMGMSAAKLTHNMDYYSFDVKFDNNDSIIYVYRTIVIKGDNINYTRGDIADMMVTDGCETPLTEVNKIKALDKLVNKELLRR